MAIVDKSEDKNEQKTAEAIQREKEEAFLNELAGESADKDTDKEKKDDGDAEEETEEDESEESTKEAEESEEESEEAEEEATEDGSEDEGKESSSQKRINELTREKKRLESELARAKGEKADGPKDPDLEKLEKLSVDELKALRKECRIKSRVEKDEAQVQRYIDLEDKIDDAIQSAPGRFDQLQLREYQTVVQETSEELGERFTEKVQTKIFEKAKAIFEKSPSLRKAVDGQAVSWQLAVDWYKDTSKLSERADKSSELERESNKLKRKVSLDTAVQKGASKESENHRLFKRAKGGDKGAELDWVKKELNL